MLSVSTFTTGPFFVESNGKYMTGIIMLNFHWLRWLIKWGFQASQKPPPPTCLQSISSGYPLWDSYWCLLCTVVGYTNYPACVTDWCINWITCTCMRTCTSFKLYVWTYHLCSGCRRSFSKVFTCIPVENHPWIPMVKVRKLKSPPRMSY